MKRYIRAQVAEDEDQYFQPDIFNKDSVDQILDNLFEELKKKFSRRYKDAEYKFENVHFDDYYLASDIKILNHGKEVISKKFEFQPYSDYWDETDYQQHIQTTIQKFLRNI